MNNHVKTSAYDSGLGAVAANYAPLTPLGFLERAAQVFPDRISLIHGERQDSWKRTFERCKRLASALQGRGLGPGDTVGLIAANIPAHYEAHFGVPMAGCVLNSINTRLDAQTVAFILEHGEAKLLLVDRAFAQVAALALATMSHPPPVIDIDDDGQADHPRIGQIEYEDFLKQGDADFSFAWPDDEWRAIALNYTSGTTGNPKGVVYHHRGAYLNALGNAVTWSMAAHPVYLWTLPMFHCNGWCFPWTLAALGGTSVCLRRIDAPHIFSAIAEHKVSHFCGAPVVLGMVINASDAERKPFAHKVKIMTAAAPPPAVVLERIEAQGFEVTHVYGLTEVYGPATVCAWHPEWDGLEAGERARLKARQGVRYVVEEGLMVAHPETLKPVPHDGQTMGEVFFRGNVVMKGYLKNPKATEEALAGGWFHSGDLGVVHADGYIELKDRSKDIIISGGENISTIEVEAALYQHPAVAEAAVVARPDEKWGETPCAFVTLKPDAQVSADEIIAFCRTRLAHFKCPKTVVFSDLPKTSTGKIQKFALRDRAKGLGETK
ncbi:Acyl-CoA synthetase (AMP-forming)/AMP-acid ligase II [Rhodospirillaceae bacterium LM-1]|nr:Acyl-CoA synthetase (AMP-forming)/AMP-acid ligase II [Rhodospirillaceae bacterium LM-1]